MRTKSCVCRVYFTFLHKRMQVFLLIVQMNSTLSPPKKNPIPLLLNPNESQMFLNTICFLLRNDFTSPYMLDLIEFLCSFSLFFKLMFVFYSLMTWRAIFVAFIIYFIFFSEFTHILHIRNSQCFCTVHTYCYHLFLSYN